MVGTVAAYNTGDDGVPEDMARPSLSACFGFAVQARTEDGPVRHGLVLYNTSSDTTIVESLYSVLPISSDRRSVACSRNCFHVRVRFFAGRSAFGWRRVCCGDVCRLALHHGYHHRSRDARQPHVGGIGRTGIEFIDGFEAFVSGTAA